MAFRLRQGTVVLGRGDECDIVLFDRKLSKRHFSVEIGNDGVFINDLDSTHGTLLNGVACTRAALGPDDLVEAGAFRFSIADNIERPVRGGAAAGAPHNLTEELPAIIDKLADLGSGRKFLDRLLLSLISAIGADRGYVLLMHGPENELGCVASHEIERQKEFLAISSTVCARAIETCSTIVVEDSSVSSSDSPLSLAFYPGPKTIVCSPLRSADGAFGVVYVDLPRIDGDDIDNVRRYVSALAALAGERLSKERVKRRLLATVQRMNALCSLRFQGYELVLDNGACSRKLKTSIKSAADSDVSVLITGETGTGKEMVARAVHLASPRSGGAFVAINCASMPSDLVKLELFGAEAGAFTGADTRRVGRIELADKGTLFLDEVVDLPLPVQAALLRVLEERCFFRLGADKALPVDFRLICATNRPLEPEVDAGNFRADLYYRLNVFRIELKPLRERPGLIPVLANHFLSGLSSGEGRFSDSALRSMLSYHWPGNIREMKNCIERAVLLCEGNIVTERDLRIQEPGADASVTAHDQYDKAREIFDRRFIERSLLKNRGNIAAVVRQTGLGRPTVYRWIKRFGLRSGEPEDSKD